jgi:hypothetical protein
MSEPTAPKKTTKKPSATSKTGIKKPRAKATGATRVKPKTKLAPKSNEVPHPNKKVVLVLSLFFIAMLMVAWVYWSLQRQLDLGDKGYTLQVERGQNYSQVLAKMNQDGVVKNLFLAKLYLKVSKTKPSLTFKYNFAKNKFLTTPS